MVGIPFPTSNAPGNRPQDGNGRLINVFAEQRGDGSYVWRRVPGATHFITRYPAVASMSGTVTLTAVGNST